MAKGYWLARLNIKDREIFAEYRKRNAAPIAAFGGRFVVKGGRAETMLGVAAVENVVIEFDSYEQAIACFRSPDYQAAAESLKRSAEIVEFVVVEGAA